MTDIEVKITNAAPPSSQSNYPSNISRSPINGPSAACGLQLNQNIPSPSSPLSSLSSHSSNSSPPTANSNTGLRIIKEASLVGDASQISSPKTYQVGNTSVSKKSRKSKTPVACRNQQKKVTAPKSTNYNKDSTSISSVGGVLNLTNLYGKDRGMDMIAEKNPNTNNTLSTGGPNMSHNITDSIGMPLPPPSTGIKSYSDFMRNLAAKYNNNDYNTPPRNAMETPFPPFKTGTTPLATSNTNQANTSAPQSNSLLGNFPSPFPFPLGHGGLGSLGLTAANIAAAAAAAAGNKHLLDDKAGDSSKQPMPTMGGIPGIAGLSMQSMMDLTSTHQALLSLARSAAASSFSSTIPTSNSSPSNMSTNVGNSDLEPSGKPSIGQPKKRTASGTVTRANAECPLDLSGPQLLPSKRARLSTDTAMDPTTDTKSFFRSDSDRHESTVSTQGHLTASLLTNGGPSSLLTMQSNSKPSIQIQVDPTILNWSVDEVVDFVSSIDICKEYSEVFREHNIDGSSLPLLTEDHLTLRLGMKLGPALKLKSIISKKLGPAHVDICVHCAHCNNTSKNATRNSNLSSSALYQDQQGMKHNLDVNLGEQNKMTSNMMTSALPSTGLDERRSPSENSNVSTGNVPMSDVKEEPVQRTSSRNSMTNEKNDSS